MSIPPYAPSGRSIPRKLEHIPKDQINNWGTRMVPRQWRSSTTGTDAGGVYDTFSMHGEYAPLALPVSNGPSKHSSSGRHSTRPTDECATGASTRGMDRPHSRATTRSTSTSHSHTFDPSYPSYDAGSDSSSGSPDMASALDLYPDGHAHSRHTASGTHRKSKHHSSRRKDSTKRRAQGHVVGDTGSHSGVPHAGDINQYNSMPSAYATSGSSSHSLGPPTYGYPASYNDPLTYPASAPYPASHTSQSVARTQAAAVPQSGYYGASTYGGQLSSGAVLQGQVPMHTIPQPAFSSNPYTQAHTYDAAYAGQGSNINSAQANQWQESAGYASTYTNQQPGWTQQTYPW